MAEEKNSAAAREQFLYEAVAHLDHLYRVAFHLASEPEEAEDLVQETYLRAMSAHEQFTLGTNMKAWLTRILYNFFFDRYHEKKRWISVEDGVVGGTEAFDYSETVPTVNPGPESYALIKELNAKISEALRKLPPDFRVPIILVDMEDFSYAEAAEVLSCPIGTIRSRVSRGRKLLHKYLKSYVGKGTK
ncbi:MAG TPA: sigma-70 family RNA polymerase sigma factor [Candidatus Binatia bacterium]|nr:sigma-70 family RNA polymerase sigma factor [Candidatus Binatia bacterium]